MTLKAKIGLKLFSGTLAVLVLSQAVQFVQAKRSNRKLAASSETLLQERELQNIKNIHAAVAFTLSDGLARGDMDVFQRLITLKQDMPGLEEFSVYSLKGIVTDSSDKSALNRQLDPELKSQLFSKPDRLIQITNNSIEIYKPEIATAKCLECHNDCKVGAVRGIIYLRFSNNGATQLAAQFSEISTSANHQWQGLSVAILIIGGLVAAGLTLVITGPILKKLIATAKHLDASSAEVAAAAGQVAAASQSLAGGASEQAASLEQTGSSLEEMSSMTKSNAENAQKANDLARQARSAADKGVDNMQAMSAAMEAIKASSNDIAKIIKTIDEIAFQTNILALNAAVEAARAGEAGMSFAVVAEEVRNLAQRSAQAAKETAAKIEGAIGNTAQGVEISDKVAQTLNEIVTKARQVDELATEVASASREQTQGIIQINLAVGQMDKVTQSNAASAEESAAAAEELNAQAFAMKESVGQLLKLIGGKAQTMAASTIPASVRPRKTQATDPAVTGNGDAQTDSPKPAKRVPRLETTSGAAGNHRKSENPLEGDFKDF
jgi:methyl-accepting chemotaxis protein